MTVLDCLEVGPERGDARGSVIWMHGLGADGNDFAPIVPMLGLPDVRFVFPHAPVMPVTLNGGAHMRAWYDIVSLQRGPGREPEPGIRASATQIEALIRREVDRAISPERIVIAGFSQGAAMALHVGVRHVHTLAGIMVLSGYQLLPDTVLAERAAANVSTPLLFCHGTDDEVLPLSEGRSAHDFMVEHADGADIRWHPFPIGHSVSENEIAVVGAWLADRFA